MIKYFVRTTEDRIFDYNLEYEKLVDREHKPVESFIHQLEYLSEGDSILLEDDLILCDDFKKKIEEVISQYPNKIINFFTKPYEGFTTHEEQNFGYNQCTYYPKGSGKILANKMRELYRRRPELQYDDLEHLALRQLEGSHVQYRPCLVQHRDVKSLIGNDAGRISPYFIDWLEELDIDYHEAYKKVNRDKLIEKIKGII